MDGTGPVGAFTPGRIGGLTLPNRIVMGSMHLNTEDRADGGVSVAAFYAARARGGAGLIVTGGSAVDRVGAGGRHYGLVNEPAHHDAMARWSEAVHAEGGLIALQLFHAGRYAFESSFGLPPVAPSAVYSGFSRCTPEAMSEERIDATLDAFAQGAAHARRLGFDAVEVMASEGYLVNQFVSPVTNRRDDGWGGDARRRTRFPLELLRRIRAAVGEAYPVIFRISGADLVDGSSTPEEIADYAVALADGGVDALNVGVGWHEARVPTVQTMVPTGAWLPEAGAVKDAVRARGRSPVPVIASNRINRIEMARATLAAGAVDFVSMARPFLADPSIVAKSRDRGANGSRAINLCIACNEACIDRSLGDEAVSCLVNPRAGRELDYPEPDRAAPAAGPRSYVVVGGGPGGLEAARALASLGHRVELFEAADELGGQFRMARQVPGKADFGETIRYFEAELARLGVRVRLKHRLGEADVADLARFDGVILATGVVPRAVDIPGAITGAITGARLPHVRTYAEAFEDPEAIGDRVAIIGGGGIALDLAHLLGGSGESERSREAFRAEYGLGDRPEYGPGDRAGTPEPARTITVMRRAGRIGQGVGKSTRWALVGTVRRHGAATLTGVTYEEIDHTGVRIVTEEGEHRVVAADSVILAAGQEPAADLVAPLRQAGVDHRVIGGAADTAGLNAVRATEQGLRAAYDLVGVG